MTGRPAAFSVTRCIFEAVLQACLFRVCVLVRESRKESVFFFFRRHTFVSAVERRVSAERINNVKSALGRNTLTHSVREMITVRSFIQPVLNSDIVLLTTRDKCPDLLERGFGWRGGSSL